MKINAHVLLQTHYGDRCSVCKTVGDVLQVTTTAADNPPTRLAFCSTCLGKDWGVDIDWNISVESDLEKRIANKEQRRTRKRSLAQETRTAKDSGGQRQPGSGSLDGAKSDVRVAGRFRIENKYTDKRQYTLKLDTLEKVSAEAGLNEVPVLQLDFRTSNRKYVIVPYDFLFSSEV